MKPIIAAALVAGVTGVTWAAGTLYSHVAIESRVHALESNPAPIAGVKIANVTHHAGMLSSDGEFDVSVGPTCDTKHQQSGHVTYHVSHIVLPTSVNRFAWTWRPTGESAAVFSKIFGANASLSGEGSIGIGGRVKTSIQLPALQAGDSVSGIAIPSSTAYTQWSANAFSIDWSLPKASVGNPRPLISAENAALHVDITDATLGTGTSSLSVGHVVTPTWSAEGIELSSTLGRNGDVLDGRFAPSVKKISIAGHTLDDLVLELAVTNIDAANSAKLMPRATGTCDTAGSLTESASERQSALLAILTHGLSVGISKLGGRLDGSRIDGDLMVTLKPNVMTARGPGDLVHGLEAHGKIELSGAVPDLPSLTDLVQIGYATQKGETVASTFQLADGEMKVNGVPVDASPLISVLAMMGQGGGAMAQASPEPSGPVAHRPMRRASPVAR